MFSTEQTQKIVKTIGLFGVIVSLFFVAKIATELRQYRFIGSGTTATNTITVSGTGKASATPDIATITFTVRDDEPTVKAAEENVNKKMNDAIAFLKKQNIEDKDIKTTNNSFYPKYSQIAPCYSGICPNVEQKIIGYEVSRSITVKVRAVDTAGTVIDGLAVVGVSDLQGPTFTIDDEDGIKADARAEAIANAREKADVLAKDLGVDIVRIVGFSENGDGAYPMPMYARAEMAMDAGAAVKNQAQLPTGENEYNSNVTITYEIR